MRRAKITIGVAGFILSGISTFGVVSAAVPNAEWRAGTQCLEAAGLPPTKLLCMQLSKRQLSAVMKAGFRIGTKTRQSWCNLVDELGLRASSDNARGKEEMAGCNSDEYMRAFERGGEVVRCITERVFMGEVDYQQWGSLATHMYYCKELGSHGDCAAAVEIAKKMRGKEPNCKGKKNSSLWRWVQRLDYVRWTLDSVYKDNCRVEAKKMLPYCESVLRDKALCQPLYGKKNRTK